MRKLVAQRTAGLPRVLEIGPGGAPFPGANEFVDWAVGPGLEGKRVHVLDVNQDPLPFDDKSIDFVYCRHTLEDIYDPVWLCREMSRVGKAGYIETPSPIAECTRGVDASKPPWRGYIHHRYIIWPENGELLILPKAPVIEHLEFTDESVTVNLLNQGPLHWNTYFFWEGDLKFRLLQHDRDFKLQSNYGELLIRAIQQSGASNLAIAGQLKSAGLAT